MKYFKIVEDSVITAIGTVDTAEPFENEISEEEYNNILAEIIANNPPEEPSDEDEISGDEFISMIEEVM